MDLDAVADQIFPVLGSLGYAVVADDAVEHFAASPRSDPAVGPHVLGALGRWIGTGDSVPAGCGLALIVDPSSGAAQAAADALAAQAEVMEIEGQPCYRYDDGGGSTYLVLCTPAMLLYLVGSDEMRLAGVAGALFRGWKANGTS